jgi:hypothetical protein
VQPRDIADSRIGLVWWCLLFLAAGMGSPASAQDTNYWTDQFGNAELLLGGAVVASVADTSAVYYNPGALALNQQRQALLSANVIDYMTVTGEQALGRGRDFDDSRLRLLPSLVAGELKLEALGKNRVAYSVLVRQSVSTRLENRRESMATSPAGQPSAIYTDSRLDANLSEYWGGLTWARPLGRKVGLGVTVFAAARDQRGRPETTVQTVRGSQQGAIGLVSRDYSFVHGRVFLKMGVNADVQKWELGLTLTTPSLGVWGRGSAGFDSSLASSGEQGQPGSARVTTDYQAGLPAHFQSPLSIGVGLTRSFGRLHLGASAEWFDRVGPFLVLEPKSFTSQSTGELLQNDISYGLGRVLNVAAGVQYDFAPSWQAFAGFHTDHSGALPRARSNSTFWTTDLYHASTGLTLKVAGADVALGFVYAWGNGDTPPFGDDLPGGDGPTSPPIKTQWRRYTVLLGLNLPFATDGGP